MPAVARSKQALDGFGKRLAEIRKARGVTQVELAERIGSSQRNLSYYESEKGHAPAPILVAIAKELEVSTDDLLGLEASSNGPQPRMDGKTKRLWKKFQQMMKLPEKDQRAVIRLINSLVAAQKTRRL
jgi:transcriptional regulator with XRE-family HTH domain